MPNEITYPYQMKLRVIVFGVISFGLCGAFMAFVARNNTEGLVIYGLIPLRRHEATVVYWLVVAVLMAFIMLAVHGGWLRLTSKQVLALGPTALRLPYGIFKVETEIPYSKIRALSLRKVNWQQFLTLHLRDGKTRHIARSMLPSGQAYDHIRAELAARIAATGKA